MAETLLSFSNVNLFGHLVGDLKIVDPGKPSKVKVATTEHMPTAKLKGWPSIDGKPLLSGDKVLVWRQAFWWQNAVYKVRGEQETWAPKYQAVAGAGFVRTVEGAEFGNHLWVLDSVSDTRRFAVSFSIPDKIDSTQQGTLQIIVDGKSLFGAPLSSPGNQSKTDFATSVAGEINKEPLGQHYLATSSQDVVAITAASSPDAGGRTVKFQTDPNFRPISPREFSAVNDAELPEESDRIFVLLGTFSRGLIDRRRGSNKQLQDQLSRDSRFARIYGFSYEGSYYDLPRPVLFLVHGTGDLVAPDKPLDLSNPSLFRAPRETLLAGIAAAGFDFANGLRVWSYDQADYTIRMDVEAGMFEQVLLDAMFEGGGSGGLESSGMNARGMNARGMNARGMNARGMNARGMNARGMNARGGGGD